MDYIIALAVLLIILCSIGVHMFYVRHKQISNAIDADCEYDPIDVFEKIGMVLIVIITASVLIALLFWGLILDFRGV